jgi:prephenate dehydratase
MIQTARSVRVAYQGEPGAYSEEALLAWFGQAVEPQPQRDFGALVGAVAEGRVPFGVLPVENTLAGAVGAACDAFLDADVDVVGEIVHPVRHCLLAREGTSLEGVRRVLSHPVALAQCGRFLARHPWMEPVAVHDTAGAAREVAEGLEEGVAAVASCAAGARYGLHVLVRDLQDRDDNQTRFWVLAGWGGPARELAGARPDGTATDPPRRKSLLAFETRNRPGALVRVLRGLADAGLNLTALTSRPGADPWTYRFLAEVDGDLTTGTGAEAVEDARGHALTLRRLGPFEVLHTGRPGPASDERAERGAEPVHQERAATVEALEEVRRGIDDVDAALVRLLARRRDLAREAQARRVGAGLPLRDPAREARVLRNAVELGRTHDLPDEAVRQVFWSVVGLCVPGLSQRASDR